MAKITIDTVTKKYEHVEALSRVSFEVKEREFVVLFGPAGAGKTTLLSVISGIQSYEEGSILFDDVPMDNVVPDKRNVAMVFENYALYPHFTVYDNIAFPLRSPEYKTDEKKIKEVIDSITKKMNINHLLHRYPSQLSNGQRQRVALGRALVRTPNVFLMDEPLAHLDAKLKNAMRTELKAIQQQLDTTTIYVTHDYLEALSLADKIVVINEGKIVQVASPDDVYYRPVNLFVAKLVGEPEINVYTCTLSDNKIIPIDSSIVWDIDKGVYKELSKQCSSDTVIVGIRGIDIKVSFEQKKGFHKGTIENFYSIGNRYVVKVKCLGIYFDTLVPGNVVLHVDDVIYCSIDTQALLFFDSKDERFITRTGGM